MKRLIIAVLTSCILLSLGTAAHAKTGDESAPDITTLSEYEIDGSLAFASGPGGYDGGVGLNFGAGYALRTIDPNLQARFDISLYTFNTNFTWGTGLYTRTPIIVSARYYMPVGGRLRAYGQAGFETSIDGFDTADHQRKNEVNFGIAPGAGVEFFFTQTTSVFGLAIVHLISDSYVSMQIGVAGYF